MSAWRVLTILISSMIMGWAAAQENLPAALVGITFFLDASRPKREGVGHGG